MVMTPYLDKDLQVGSLKLHYQEWGRPDAPPMVMLHGFGVSGHMFDEFAQRMMDRYRLIAIDQRGHGDSDWSEEGDYSRDAFVADTEGARAALGLDRFILVGHSMGGLNSVAYAVKYPEHVRALVLVDVGPEAAKEGVDNIRRFTQGPDELDFEQFVEGAHRFNPRRSIENIRARMRHRLKPTEGGKWTWKFDKRFREPETGLRIGSELSNDETWQLFRRVTAPTLLVRGAESDVLTQDVAERAVREMPRARLALVANAGHSVPGDNPDDFTEAVRAFLADVEGGRFQPIAATEPPPLAESVGRQNGRRGGSLVPFIAAGAIAVVALSALGWLVKGRKKQSAPAGLKGRAKAVAGRAHIPERVGAVDLELAQRRAADLAHELAVRGQRGLTHARSAAQEVDVEAARAAALDVLHGLGDASRQAPAKARVAAERARKEAKRSKKKGGKARFLLRTAMIAAPMIAGRATKQKKKRGLMRAWRP